MRVTQERDTESQVRDTGGYFIDIDLFDELMTARKVFGPTARAKRVGCSRSTFYRVLNHECEATLGVATQFANAAGTSVKRLFRKQGNPTPPPPSGPTTPPSPRPKTGDWQA